MPILHKCKGIRKTHKNEDKCRFLLGWDVIVIVIVHYLTILKVDLLQLSTNMMLSFGFRTLNYIAISEKIVFVLLAFVSSVN